MFDMNIKYLHELSVCEIGSDKRFVDTRFIHHVAPMGIISTLYDYLSSIDEVCMLVLSMQYLAIYL